MPKPGELRITVGALSAGCEWPALKLAVLTEGQLTEKLSGSRKKPRAAKTDNRQKIQSYTDLAVGDLVVHVHHGIGRFAGMLRLPVDGVEKDYIKINYAGSDCLYVPATSLDLVSKYIGGGDEAAEKTKLNKLSGDQWAKTTRRAKAAAKDLAEELIKLYAQRQRQTGFAFSPDSPWQREFEDDFDYTETDDQLAAIRDIKRDMEKPAPMDRLLCGGYVLPVLLAYPDVLGVFLPELLPCVGLDQRNHHHLYDVWEHTARSVAAIPPEPVLRWAMLLHDVGKPACFTVDGQGVGHFYGHPKVSAALAEEICRRLRMDKRTAHEIVTLVQWHDRDIPRTEKAIARAVHQLGEDTFRRLLAIKRADNLAQHPDYRSRLTEIDRAEAILDGLLAKQACFSLRDLAVNGGDLLALGLRGSAVGHTLNALLEQVLDGTLPNEREMLLDAVRRLP